MTTSSTARVRRHRARRKDHLAALKLEVPLEALSEKLVEDGRLQEWDCADAERVARAVEALLRAYLDQSM